jgi:hypothetical protein
MKKIPRMAGSLRPVLSALLLLFVLSGCFQQYDPRDTVPANPPPGTGSTPSDSLKGTVWIWDSPYGMRTLTFHQSAMTVTYLGQDGDDYTVSYTYDDDTRKGRIEYYGEAGFEISADYKTMHIIEWKNYGHGCDYTRDDTKASVFTLF